jgi:hypothetical protein
MKRRNGKQSAKDWGDAHEARECKTEQEKSEKEMDLHNNDIGRKVADYTDGTVDPSTGNPDQKSCKAECEDALKRGDLKVLPKDTWSG